MTNALTYTDLAIGFLPVLLVLALMWRAKQSVWKASNAIGRMLIQLLLVGYFLLYVFEHSSVLLISCLLVFMMLVASYLALNVSEAFDLSLLGHAVVALGLGGGSVLIIVTQGVLHIEPWYNPRYMIPLAGMIFASSMTAISLALERLESELKRADKHVAFEAAFKAAMIPVINAMLAVGVVSLPGMMTGQIMSGVEPYIAARYQIMVMCMIFSSTGLTLYLFILLRAKRIY